MYLGSKLNVRFFRNLDYVNSDELCMYSCTEHRYLKACLQICDRKIDNPFEGFVVFWSLSRNLGLLP